MKTCLMKACRLLCVTLTLPLYLLEITGLCGLYKRVFPLLAYNITFSYNAKMHKTKRELFRNVATFANDDGALRLLEIGCGSGANFRFYPDGCTVTCADPNPHFQKYLRMSMDANAHLTYGAFVVASGEDMEAVKDESVDVVVCTLVLCSVTDVQRVLQEVRRVLRTSHGRRHDHSLGQRAGRGRCADLDVAPVFLWYYGTQLHCPMSPVNRHYLYPGPSKKEQAVSPGHFASEETE
uniref:Methyltransferase type 11 domain-containing protein n=1 Tax=Gasterosteus aculeatus aculeatus TaxID=481459 RepID=G3N6D4_GASAC